MMESNYVVQEAMSADLDWSEGGRVHNWRNHVGTRTKALWSMLPDTVKVAIALDADDRAGQEEWE